MNQTHAREELHREIEKLLETISRWGSSRCMDRATRSYLAPFDGDCIAQMKMLEDLSYRLLVKRGHDPKIDVVYDFLTSRVHELSYRPSVMIPAE